MTYLLRLIMSIMKYLSATDLDPDLIQNLTRAQFSKTSVSCSKRRCKISVHNCTKTSWKTSSQIICSPFILVLRIPWINSSFALKNRSATKLPTFLQSASLLWIRTSRWLVVSTSAVYKLARCLGKPRPLCTFSNFWKWWRSSLGTSPLGSLNWI